MTNKTLLAVASRGWSDKILTLAEQHKNCDVFAVVYVTSAKSYTVPYFEKGKYPNLKIKISSWKSSELQKKLFIMNHFMKFTNNNYLMIADLDCDYDFDMDVLLQHYGNVKSKSEKGKIVRFDETIDEVRQNSVNQKWFHHREFGVIELKDTISNCIFDRSSIDSFLKWVDRKRLGMALQNSWVNDWCDTLISLMISEIIPIESTPVNICARNKDKFVNNPINDINNLNNFKFCIDKIWFDNLIKPEVDSLVVDVYKKAIDNADMSILPNIFNHD